MGLRAVEPRAVRGAPSVRLVDETSAGGPSGPQPHLVVRRPASDPLGPELVLRRERGRRPLRASRPR